MNSDKQKRKKLTDKQYEDLAEAEYEEYIAEGRKALKSGKNFLSKLRDKASPADKTFIKKALKESKKAKIKGTKATKKLKRTVDLKGWLTNKLRRLSYQWPEMREATSKARVERGKYKCASCGGIFGPKEINRDHIEPVDNPHTGFTTWDNYIDRLFCPADGIQILCSETCHKYKSSREQILRRELRKTQKTESEDGDI